MNRLLIVVAFMFGLSLPCYAQFIGIGISMPPATQQAAIGGGGGIPNNAMTFNGKYMLFNGSYMTFSGTP